MVREHVTPEWTRLSSRWFGALERCRPTPGGSARRDLRKLLPRSAVELTPSGIASSRVGRRAAASEGDGAGRLASGVHTISFGVWYFGVVPRAPSRTGEHGVFSSNRIFRPGGLCDAVRISLANTGLQRMSARHFVENRLRRNSRR